MVSTRRGVCRASNGETTRAGPCGVPAASGVRFARPCSPWPVPFPPPPPQRTAPLCSGASQVLWARPTSASRASSASASGLPGAAHGAICRGRLADLPVLAQEDSARARGLRPREVTHRLARAAAGVLPSASVNSVGTSNSLISRLNTLPARSPVNASAVPSRGPDA